VLFARWADKLGAVASEVGQRHGVRALPVRGDMLSAADVDPLRAAIQREFGGLDILVLNTGRAPNPLRTTMEETDEARRHEAYNNQLWGAIQVAKTVLPLMLGGGWGRVVAVTSARRRPKPAGS